MALGLKRNIVELIDYDSEWEKLANETIQKLWQIFGSVAKDIQHIGSTSIKNIKAKPIIDIAVAVNDFGEFEPLIPALEINGFSYRGWFLVDRITVLNVYEELQSGDKATTHHIHLVKFDSRDWNDHIKFRDYLNTHPSVAKDYEAIKIKLASEHPIDENRKKYNDGKNSFINQTLKDAAAWEQMENIKTGWERERRTHFDEIVVNYDKARWDYPPELFSDICEYKGTSEEKIALEIGAGTGKATVPFLTAGYIVTAVELGANMADFMLDKFKDYSGFNVIISAFEEAELAESSYDLIYAASAFHWVDAEIGCPKVLRLLKSGGTFALFRNNLVDGYELYDDFQKLYEKYYLSIYPANTKPVKNTRTELSQPSGIYHGYRFYGMREYGFTDLTMKFYEVTHSYDADEYIALLETHADHRGLPESNKIALYDGIKKAIKRHGGYCKQDYLFQLYMGKKP